MEQDKGLFTVRYTVRSFLKVHETTSVKQVKPKNSTHYKMLNLVMNNKDATYFLMFCVYVSYMNYIALY